MDRRRWIALALCLLLALSMAASSAYLAHEAAHPHDCVGKDCPVCRFIALLERVARGFALLLAALFALLTGAEHACHAFDGAAMPVRPTPVRLRIRLND